MLKTQCRADRIERMWMTPYKQGVLAMRRINWILAAAVFVGVAGPAASLDAGCGCAECNGAMAAGYWALGGPACCSPPGYCLAPGCGEDSRPCCDNAWAGYCQRKAKVQAFWAKVGVPKPPRRRPAFYRYIPWLAPSCDGPSPTAQPTPDVPPAPPVSSRTENDAQAGGLGKLLRLF